MLRTLCKQPMVMPTCCKSEENCFRCQNNSRFNVWREKNSLAQMNQARVGSNLVCLWQAWKLSLPKNVVVEAPASCKLGSTGTCFKICIPAWDFWGNGNELVDLEGYFLGAAFCPFFCFAGFPLLCSVALPASLLFFLLRPFPASLLCRFASLLSCFFAFLFRCRFALLLFCFSYLALLLLCFSLSKLCFSAFLICSLLGGLALVSL